VTHCQFHLPLLHCSTVCQCCQIRAITPGKLIVYLQDQRAAGPDRGVTPHEQSHISGSIAAAKQASEGYRPASAALSLRSFGRWGGPRSPSATARPVTALPKSPSQLEVPKKLSPKKAASAGPTLSPVRKASAAITLGRQFVASQQHGMQQENQALSLDSKGPQRSPEGIESGVRPALQESPTRSAAECCPVCISPQYCLHPLCGSFSYIVNSM